MGRLLLTVACLMLAPMAAGQERIGDFDNSLRAEYQFIHTGDLDTSFGPLDVGTTDTQVVLLSGVYSLTDRWKIYGSLPYVQKRFDDPTGYGVHNPQVDFYEFTPPDLRFVDDGSYHGGLQDLYVGVQYLAIDGPAFTLSPFVSFGTPTTDYPIYGGAVIGRGLNEVPVGVSMDFTPYFSDWYFQADVAYVFSEEVLGVDLDYWLAYLSASYYVTPRLAPRIFVTSRNAPNALIFPEDFPDFDSENFYHHDQTIKHSYVNAGIGFDYIVSDRYEISATYFKTIDPEYIYEIEYAFTLALLYKF